MLKKYLFFLFFIASQILAQQIGQWQNYTDMKNISASAWYNNKIWAATEGGGFVFNLEDSTYQQFTQSEGLTNQILSALAIDSEGKIWFGSLNGAINIYNPDDQTTSAISDIANSNKKNKSINEIYTSGNTIYLSTAFGISVINSTELTYDDTYQKLGNFQSETPVNSVFKSNLIYAATTSGIAIQKSGTTNLASPDSWNSYELGIDIAADTVYKITEYKNIVIAATNTGIHKFDGNNWIQQWFSELEIIDMVVNNNFLYCITNQKLISFDGTSSNTLYTSSSQNLKKIAIAANNEFLISTTTGVVKMSGNKNSVIYPNGPASNLFVGLTVDTEGNLWAASGKNGAGEGFYKYNGNTWTNYTKSSGHSEITSNDYMYTYSGQDGKAYMCNWGAGLTIVNKEGNLTTYNTNNTDMVGISTTGTYIVISGALDDNDGNMWILNYWAADMNYLVKVTPEKTWTFYSLPSSYLSSRDHAKYLAIDQYNTKWFAATTYNEKSDKGLYYFNENGIPGESGTYGRLTTSDGLTSGSINALAVDNRGELWIGKSPGIDVLQTPSSPKASAISRVTAFRNQNINCITVDPINRKWIGTMDGAYLVSSDGLEIIEHYTSKNSPLPVNEIKSIAIDENSGKVYFGTDFGLSSLLTSSVKPSESFQDIFSYPNPFKIDETSNKVVTIEGLIKSAEIKILSISGKLIRVLESGSEFAPGGSLAFWDGRDENGNFVQSGVYIVAAYDNDGSNVKTSKIAVVRK